MGLETQDLDALHWRPKATAQTDTLSGAKRKVYVRVVFRRRYSIRIGSRSPEFGECGQIDIAAKILEDNRSALATADHLAA
jgi:hypothetical protein